VEELEEEGEEELGDIDTMSIKDLKAYVVEQGGSIEGIREKDELQKLVAVLRANPQTRTSLNDTSSAYAELHRQVGCCY
jgi:hypothetical protein